MRVIVFWKCSKFNAHLKNVEKNWEKMFCFWDKCIWMVWIHLCLLIREYLSLAVNGLRKILKNFHVSESDFCNSVTFPVISQDGKSALIKIESVFRTVYLVACREVLFCNSITFPVISQDGKSALIKIESVFRTVYHVACREVLSNGSV